MHSQPQDEPLIIQTSQQAQGVLALPGKKRHQHMRKRAADHGQDDLRNGHPCKQGISQSTGTQRDKGIPLEQNGQADIPCGEQPKLDSTYHREQISITPLSPSLTGDKCTQKEHIVQE